MFHIRTLITQEVKIPLARCTNRGAARQWKLPIFTRAQEKVCQDLVPEATAANRWPAVRQFYPFTVLSEHPQYEQALYFFCPPLLSSKTGILFHFLLQLTTPAVTHLFIGSSSAQLSKFETASASIFSRNSSSASPINWRSVFWRQLLAASWSRVPSRSTRCFWKKKFTSANERGRTNVVHKQVFFNAGRPSVLLVGCFYILSADERSALPETNLIGCFAATLLRNANPVNSALDSEVIVGKWWRTPTTRMFPNSWCVNFLRSAGCFRCNSNTHAFHVLLIVYRI